MRVLVACEFSGVVRDAFIARGHDALSCDLEPSECPGPHYQGDVRDILFGDSGYWGYWDMLIAFPPCTYLTAAGAHLWKHRQQHLVDAQQFVLTLYHSGIERVAIENPQGWLNSHWRKPDQTFNPYWFGVPYKKRTCLWLKNLPPLVPTNYLHGVRASWVNSGNNYRNHYGEGWTKGVQRNPRERSRTFQQVADAMASQWAM